jgi:hypothetical protein
MTDIVSQRYVHGLKRGVTQALRLGCCEAAFAATFQDEITPDSSTSILLLGPFLKGCTAMPQKYVHSRTFMYRNER